MYGDVNPTANVRMTIDDGDCGELESQPQMLMAMVANMKVHRDEG